MDAIDRDLLKGLRALSESAFPKHCSVCGRQFDSVEDFVRATNEVSGSRGLKEGWDDDDSTIVELFRNCPCGSTLMDFFSDRRDTSEAGLKRRERFGQLMEQLVSRGIAEDTARTELLKVLKGKNSPVLEKMGYKIKRK